MAGGEQDGSYDVRFVEYVLKHILRFCCYLLKHFIMNPDISYTNHNVMTL